MRLEKINDLLSALKNHQEVNRGGFSGGISEGVYADSTDAYNINPPTLVVNRQLGIISAAIKENEMDYETRRLTEEKHRKENNESTTRSYRLPVKVKREVPKHIPIPSGIGITWKRVDSDAQVIDIFTKKPIQSTTNDSNNNKKEESHD